MPKSKKYRKKQRGYKRKLANAPNLLQHNRHEPIGIGYDYNRLVNIPIAAGLHYENNRRKDLEGLEALKRVQNRKDHMDRIGIAVDAEKAYLTGIPAAVSQTINQIVNQTSTSTQTAPRPLPKFDTIFPKTTKAATTGTAASAASPLDPGAYDRWQRTQSSPVKKPPAPQTSPPKMGGDDQRRGDSGYRGFSARSKSSAETLARLKKEKAAKGGGKPRWN